jgi:hypothetical protein
MMLDVLKRLLYFVGHTTARLMWAGPIAFLDLAYGGTPQGRANSLELPAVFVAAALVAVVAHELGHLLACLAVGVKAKAFRLGDERYAIRFRVQTVQVSLGLPYKGRVEYDGAASVGRRAVITLAGSLVDLALAGLVLGAAMAASGQAARPLAVAVALGFAATGLAGLLPYRNRSGRLSDGARLFELRSDARTAELRAVQKKAARLLRMGRAEELLELHAALDDPSDRMRTAEAVIRTVIEFDVAILAGLPEDAVDRAERRLEMLVRRRDLDTTEAAAHLALALQRLRQGGVDDNAAAERHCAQALAVKNVPDSVRRMALAAIIVSRQARGLPDEDIHATAAATLPALDHGPEAMAASLKAILHPEAVLRAFRAGDSAARLGVGAIAAMLRRQRRIGELLDVHAGFGEPAGRNWRAQAQSLHDVEYNLLCVPGLPSEVIDEAAVRTRWLMDNYPFKAKEDPELQPAMEHSLALARLRQGRFGEVEPLCGSGLGADFGPDNRATVLATIVIARRALGQPHADLLAEAVALSPGADLVAEARSSADEPLNSLDG